MHRMRSNASEYCVINSVIHNITEIRGDVLKFVYKSTISLYCPYDMFCPFFLVIFLPSLPVSWREYDQILVSHVPTNRK